MEQFSIAPATAESDPLTLALVMDVSGSREGRFIEATRGAASHFLRQLAPEHPVCLYSSARPLTRLLNCASDREAVIEVIDQLAPVEDGSFPEVLLRVGEELAGVPGQQGIVLLSDGAGRSDPTTLAGAVDRLKGINLPLHVIALRGEQLDEAVARELAASRPQELPGRFEQIQSHLTSQYRLTFDSPFPERAEGSLLRLLADNEGELLIERYFVVSP